MEEKLNTFINNTDKRFERIENKVDKVEERLEKVEKDISFLREEVRIGFHTLNDTLNAMFNITASSVKANKEVAEIMETAYSEAAGKYSEIKAKSKS